ncbi:MAG: hypothetical protein VX335_00015 [Pseudomonadota bacterium]|nr:hypothetical protein [Pseudomonadota bacterium]
MLKPLNLKVTPRIVLSGRLRPFISKSLRPGVKVFLPQDNEALT